MTSLHSPGYIIHTLCTVTKKVLFFTSHYSHKVSYKQSEAAVYSSVEHAYQAAAILEMELSRRICASVNGDYIHGDKVRIKLAAHHHLCKQFPAYAERLQQLQEGKIISTRWSNIDGKWIVLAEINISLKAIGQGHKRTHFTKVTCTQSIDMPTLLTAATIIPIKSNRMSSKVKKQPTPVTT